MSTRPSPPEPAPHAALAPSTGRTHDAAADAFTAAIATGLLAAEPAGARVGVGEIAEHASATPEAVARRLALLGIAPPDNGVPTTHTSIVEVFEVLSAADDLLGIDRTDELIRLLGEILGRLADALVSTFAVSLGTPAHHRDSSLRELTRQNARFATMLPALVHTIDVVLRHHIEIARRPTPDVGYVDDRPSYESRWLAIGFADLTASTSLSERIDFADLSQVLARFEQIATEAVASRGGRIVKLIGDGVMFAAPSPSRACEIAADLLHRVDREAGLPPVRAGIASGEVLLRHGDCFGPVVNLAARLADQADPGSVALTDAFVEFLPRARLAPTRTALYTARGSRHCIEIVVAVPTTSDAPPLTA